MVRALSLLLFPLCAWPLCAWGSANFGQTNWTTWGNSLRFDRFAPADQINTTNVAQLRPVWKYELAQKGQWQATPLVVDGVMFVQDMQGGAEALDPETGRLLWQYSSGLHGKMRALAYWPGDHGHGPRVIMAILDRIYALDARSGTPIPAFGGSRGYIDVRQGFAEEGVHYMLTSPPTVYKNLLITGPSILDFGSKGPSGDPRAYDVVTGKLVWRFHLVPRPGEKNFGTWGHDGWRDRSGPSSWGMRTVDEETGLVFIPTGNPADSYIGIDRPGNNLYADSVVALDAATGRYRWHFQMVHHDLFDYDIAAPPALVDLVVKGKLVKALVEVSKQGLMFILDRRTGKPVFGVEERPVPPSTVPGEQGSPTQPFPKKPIPLAKMGMTRADISTITPEANRFCTDLWNRLGLEDSQAFQPPRLNGPSLFIPSNIGGAGGVWGGVSIDPRTGYIFTNTNNLPQYHYIVPVAGANRSSKGVTIAQETAGEVVTSGYQVQQAFTKLLDPNGMPCVQPPWGELIAVNGNTGEIAWRTPLGSSEIYGDVGAHTGMINLGGSLATAGGLVFIGATGATFIGAKYDQPVFHAYDSRTGAMLWEVRLSAATSGAPMSFVGKSGRQYIVVAVSGATTPAAETALIAFALPRPGDPTVDVNAAPMPSLKIGVAAPAAVEPVAAVDIKDLPPGEGHDDFAKSCSACHSITTVTGLHQSRDGWAGTIEDMRSRGADMDDATAVRIRDYLSVHFGPN